MPSAVKLRRADTANSKTQRLVIYYKFVGYLDIDPTQCHPDYTADIREGVAIEYVSCEPPDSLKELFSEGYNADVNSTVKDWNCAPTIRGMMDLMIAA